MNLAKIFSFESYEFTPKYAYSTIKDFTIKHKNQNSFDKLKDSMLSLEHIKQDSYVLQIDSGNWDRSVESYFFSIYSDKSGYYLRTDDNKIKHFHNKNKAPAVLQHTPLPFWKYMEGKRRKATEVSIKI